MPSISGPRIRIAEITSMKQPTSSSSTFIASRKVIGSVTIVPIHSASAWGTCSTVSRDLMLSATATMGNSVPSSFAVSTEVLKKSRTRISRWTKISTMSA